MKTIEIARKLAELNQKEKAQKAFTLALHENNLAPEEELEAASYIFFSKGDHRIAFTSFVSLFNQGLFQAEIWDLMTQAFYLPNVQEQQKRYGLNIKKLEEYPYFFRSDFPAFEDLPMLFFPFDEKGFVPFDPQSNQFGEYINFNDAIIDRWFFKDLSKPVLTTDLFSQYQLEYLNDSVRPSEWVAKENHIYLHYTDWVQFCAYLPVLDFSQILKDKKFIFLFGDEVSQYPFDFKERYGIDYTQNEVKPLGLREINRLIWHAQLSTDNGGDFFNEICYGHPNLIAFDSIMMEDVEKTLEKSRQRLRQNRRDIFYIRQLLNLKTEPTDKDILVSLYLNNRSSIVQPDPEERIAPALFFQPHFPNIFCDAHIGKDEKTTVLTSESYDTIQNSPVFKHFKYIKTFFPMRRITTRYAATMRSVVEKSCYTDEEKENTHVIIVDTINEQLLSRNYLVDPYDRIKHDSRLVRFEDGKLHPKATFTALAEFLDIPYTETMTYCSGPNGMNPESYRGNAIGFDPRTVYATYDEYANDEERAFLEYFMRDVYETYGYAFQYYKGEPVDEAWIRDKIAHFTCANQYIYESWRDYYHHSDPQVSISSDRETQQTSLDCEAAARSVVEDMDKNRLDYSLMLLRGLYFVNMDNQPMRMMEPLKLDPALLDGPAYH